MATLANMVLDDPASFNILTDDLKSKIITAATAQVNIQAALTRKKAVAEINDNFTLRNNFTVRQTQFTKAENAKTLDAIHAEIGATEKASYMKRQEEGGSHEPLAGRNIGIPTDAARGGNAAAPVLQKYRLNQIKALKITGDFKAQTGTRKSRQAARAAVAFREGKLIRYGENLFSVDSFSAKGGEVSFRKTEVYNIEKPYTETKPRPWLMPSAESSAANGEKIFASQMKKLGL